MLRMGASNAHWTWYAGQTCIMPGIALTPEAVLRAANKAVSFVRDRGVCPFREHRRRERTFCVYQARETGAWLYKCWSCDPPENTGDMVKLYAELHHVERTRAWTDLLAQGFDVPGADPLDLGGRRAQGGPGWPRPPARPRGPPPIPIRGTRIPPVLPLDPALVEHLRRQDTGVLERFAALRGLPVALLREHDVVEVRGNIGFVYRNPVTGEPCRIKVKNLGTHPPMPYWIIPMPTEDERAGTRNPPRALGPLYLAHLLEPSEAGFLQPAVTVEGETDALTLKAMGIPNVVSLPDGVESAKTVNLEPLFERFNVWLIATDNDKPGKNGVRPGEHGYEVLRDRARTYADPVRVLWSKLEGEELVTYKDANEALVKGKFTREDFLFCLKVAVEARLGQSIDGYGA